LTRKVYLCKVSSCIYHHLAQPNASIFIRLHLTRHYKCTTRERKTKLIHSEYHALVHRSFAKRERTCAFILAPSMYTCPPASWTIEQRSVTSVSKTPYVEGYVIMNAARLSRCLSTAARKSATSTSPDGRVFTTTTCKATILSLHKEIIWKCVLYRNTLLT
jgi:hypothetical protein